MAASSGRYRLSIRLGEQHLTGSPFEIGIRPPPSSLSLSLSTVDAGLTFAVSAAHTPRSLFARWRAYLPLDQLITARRHGLMTAAAGYDVRRGMLAALHSLATIADRRLAAWQEHRQNMLTVLCHRGSRSLGRWRQLTYTKMGIEQPCFSRDVPWRPSKK